MLFFWYLGIFKEALNVFTDSQYAERVLLHIESTEFTPDDTDMTLLFIKVQDNQE